MTKYFFLACFIQVLWALSPSASQMIMDELPAELYASLRWTISGLLFLLVALWKRQAFPSFKGDGLRCVVLGILGFGIASLGMLYGLKLGGVVNFAFVAAAGPVVTALVAIAVLREKVRPSYWVSLGLCVFGLIAIVAGKHGVSGVTIALSSSLLILSGYFFEALPFVYSKKRGAEQPLFSYMATLQLSAAVFMWFSQPLSVSQLVSLGFPSWKALGLLLFVSAVACCFCYMVLYWLLRFIDGHRLALFDGVHVVFAAIFGVILFGESFNALMLVGAGILLVALYLANAPSKAVEL